MSTLSASDGTFAAPRAINKNEVAFDLTKRRHGTCKFFNSQKGFGFINDQDPEQLGNQEVFVHYTAITVTGKGGFRSLAEGEEVEYLLQPGTKGFQAVEVSGPYGAPVQGDPKAKLPKSPALMGYPTTMGMLPYLESRGSPWLVDNYMGPGFSPMAYFCLPAVPQQYPGVSSPGSLGASPLVQMPALRSPVQAFGQHGMPVSPHMMGGYTSLGNMAIGSHDGVRSPILNNGGMGGSSTFSTQGFTMVPSNLGLRGEAGRSGGERAGDDGRSGGRAGDNSGFPTMSPNPLLYPQGGQVGGY